MKRHLILLLMLAALAPQPAPCFSLPTTRLISSLTVARNAPLSRQDSRVLTTPGNLFYAKGRITAVNTLVGPGATFIEQQVELYDVVPGQTVTVACVVPLDCAAATLWLNCAGGIPIDNLLTDPEDPSITIHHQVCAEPTAVGSCTETAGVLRDPVQRRVGLLADTIALAKGCGP